MKAAQTRQIGFVEVNFPLILKVRYEIYFGTIGNCQSAAVICSEREKSPHTPDLFQLNQIWDVKIDLEYVKHDYQFMY